MGQWAIVIGKTSVKLSWQVCCFPSKKAPNNIVLVCKKYYIDCLIKIINKANFLSFCNANKTLDFIITRPSLHLLSLKLGLRNWFNNFVYNYFSATWFIGLQTTIHRYKTPLSCCWWLPAYMADRPWLYCPLTIWYLSSPRLCSCFSIFSFMCMFCRSCLSFCTFSLDHCVVCSSSIDGRFWLPLLYFQTLRSHDGNWQSSVSWQ